MTEVGRDERCTEREGMGRNGAICSGATSFDDDMLAWQPAMSRFEHQMGPVLSWRDR